MRKCCYLFLFAVGILSASAQKYPTEWLKYTSDGYLYDIQSDYNNKNLSETDFKDYLLKVAYTNLAGKIQMSVKEEARLHKSTINGHSNITYTSSTHFSTDINLKLAESKAIYDRESKQGFAIVYLNKTAVCKHYRSEIELLWGKVDNASVTANNYIASGFKERARMELKNVLPEFAKIEESFIWLSLLDTPVAELTELTEKCNKLEQSVKKMLSELQHSILIHLSCKADLSGSPYTILQNELKGKLARDGCSFTDAPAKADWIIRIEVNVRESNISEFGGQKFYFAYTDARMMIEKRITSQCIYDNEISVKGGHSLNYTEAARAAYKELSNRLSILLKENIKE